MKIKLVLAAIAMAVVPSIMMAQGRAVTILNVPTDARTQAMGGNEYGESSGMMTYGNATTLLYMNKKYNISLSGFQFPKIMNGGHQRFIAFTSSMKFGKHAVHLGFRTLGGLKFTDPESNISIKPKAWTLDLAYGMKVWKGLSVAGKMQIIQDKPAALTATSVAFDASTYYRGKGQTVNYVVGANIGNMGPALKPKGGKKVNLPIYYGAGGEMGVELADKHKLSLSTSLRYFSWPKASRMFIGNLGAEYTLYNSFSLRAGYCYGDNENSVYTLGARYKSVNVAYVKGICGNNFHTFLTTLSYSF